MLNSWSRPASGAVPTRAGRAARPGARRRRLLLQHRPTKVMNPAVLGPGVCSAFHPLCIPVLLCRCEPVRNPSCSNALPHTGIRKKKAAVEEEPTAQADTEVQALSGEAGAPAAAAKASKAPKPRRGKKAAAEKQQEEGQERQEADLPVDADEAGPSGSSPQEAATAKKGRGGKAKDPADAAPKKPRAPKKKKGG